MTITNYEHEYQCIQIIQRESGRRRRFVTGLAEIRETRLYNNRAIVLIDVMR